ncbi:transcription factor Ouib-like isoform X5 [Bacillus rossius redtenbacheri]|uniref:transcription factor Ouib-like isoform X5 n=1 Tax=Bacillus rossius redtenbacheri TaxID=93214 RepID=UPI002FDCE064
MIIVFYQCFTLRNPIFRKTNFRNLIMSNNVFEKMCRLCMSQKDKLFPIFGWDSDHKNPVQISDRIMMCASVMVAEGDGLPAQICDGCCLQLDSSYDFRKRCEHSDVTLRELISKCSSFDLEADDVKDLKDILHVSLVEEVKLEPCSSDPQELSASDQASDAADTPDAIAPQEPARPRTKGVRRGRAGSRPHQCAECQKTFTQAGDLQIHRRIHSGERPYVCDTCGKRFPSSSNLARHKRIHTGEKPFACSVCDKSFTVRSALKEHHNVHSGDKRFLCKVRAARQPQGPPQHPLVREAVQLLDVREGLHPALHAQGAPQGPQRRETIPVPAVLQGLRVPQDAQDPHEHPHRGEAPRVPDLLQVLLRAQPP